jgi:hypothetical protein
MNNKIKLRFGLISLLIFAAALSRLLPHPYNFTPIGAIGLFGAAHFSRKYLSFIIPFAALWLSDMLLNNLVYAPLYPEHYGSGFVWMSKTALYVYPAFAIIIGLGFLLLKQVKVSNLLLASLMASVLFFLITNAGAWWGSLQYSKDFGGLMAAYTAGIPFFWNTLLGDLFYTAVLFGVFEWAQQRLPALRQTQA